LARFRVFEVPRPILGDDAGGVVVESRKQRYYCDHHEDVGRAEVAG
jgi:hypothetical protein